MGQVGCAELAAWLATPGCALQELDLRDNQLGLQDALPLAFSQAFTAPSSAHKRLHELHGEHHSGRDLVASNVSLRRLNLATNELTDTGIGYLAGALQAFAGLKELLLYHNPELGSGGVQALVPILIPPITAVDMCTGLTSLNVAACNVGDIGCRTLANAISQNAPLVKLDLSNNSVTDAQPMAEALVSNNTLQELNLSLNAICLFGRRMVMCGLCLSSPSAIKCVDLSAQSAPFDLMLGADVIKASNAKASMLGLARQTRIQELTLKYDVEVGLTEFIRGVGKDVFLKCVGIEN